MQSHDEFRLRRTLTLGGVSLFVLLAFIHVAFAEDVRDAAASEQVREAAEKLVAKARIPGIVSAIGDSDGVIAIGAAGVRKMGADARMTKDDVIHIGSCTKAMTSTMLATLVADGKLTWETKLIDTLPDLRERIHADYHSATLWQLVTHRAGLPANAKNWWAHKGQEIRDRRLTILAENLHDAPTRKIGDFHYSNLSYMAAGCMAEQVADKSWETLMKERLFQPLSMKTAGFGPPATPKKVDQPWGHSRILGINWPLRYDNAEALGPAGRVHCSLRDWTKFAALLLPKKKPKLLDRQRLDKLIQPNETYAAGWGVGERPWAEGKTLSHSGSNTKWYATIWIAPKLDRVFATATNSYDAGSQGVCDKMITTLIEIDQRRSVR